MRMLQSQGFSCRGPPYNDRKCAEFKLYFVIFLWLFTGKSKNSGNLLLSFYALFDTKFAVSSRSVCLDSITLKFSTPVIFDPCATLGACPILVCLI